MATTAVWGSLKHGEHKRHRPHGQHKRHRPHKRHKRIKHRSHRHAARGHRTKRHKRRKHHPPSSSSSTTPSTPTPATGPTTPSPVTAPGSSPGKIQHVAWIWMENHGYNNVIGSSSAPYINSLASTYGLATNYFATDHPSLPNYIEATTGGSQGVSDDNSPPANVTSAPSIFSQLPNGQSRSLMEDMPANCYTSNSGNYAVRHNPEAYLSSVSGDCSNYDVPFGSSPDLSAKFTFITPNVIDDMHDGTVADGDNFLKRYVPQLMATPPYQAGNTVIFIVWDEDGLDQNNHVPCIVISPYTHSVRDGTPYTHYSLLRTAEQLLGLPLLGNAASANSMLGRFGF